MGSVLPISAASMLLTGKPTGVTQGRTKSMRYIGMNSFTPHPLLMTTDEQLAALRKNVAEDAVRRCFIAYHLKQNGQSSPA